MGSKIDHCCHIGHNVTIGKHSIVTAGVTIAGSTKIGNYVWIGPNSIIRENIFIGDNAFIGMGSVVTKSVENGWIVYGVPAKKIRKNDTIFGEY